MSFYGIPDKDKANRVLELLGEVREIYDSYNLLSYSGDNLLALLRTLAYSRDQKFMAAFERYAETFADQVKMWRIHTYCWACQSALAVDGDFVECGVYLGLYSATMANYLDFETINKTLYLYDTFDGIPEAYSDEIERRLNVEYHKVENWHARVVERFSGYPNVEIVPGVLPDSLDARSPKTIAFLHVDLNAAAAEIGALDKLFDRVSAGGIVLLDDYGRGEHPILHNRHMEWFTARGYPILEIPTGQGLVIKRSA